MGTTRAQAHARTEYVLLVLVGAILVDYLATPFIDPWVAAVALGVAFLALFIGLLARYVL